MAASLSVAALRWYARGDYAALLKLFSDPGKLPATYDDWLKRAESVERQLRRPASVSPGSGSVLFPLRLGARSETFLPTMRRA
jgi:hypothetical protein